MSDFRQITNYGHHLENPRKNNITNGWVDEGFVELPCDLLVVVLCVIDGVLPLKLLLCFY